MDITPFRIVLWLRRAWLTSALLALSACGSSEGNTNAQNDNSNQNQPGVDAGTPSDGGGGQDAEVQPDAGAQDCDYRAEGGIIVIEAESLPITQQWAVGTSDAGFTGAGYIEWTGDAHNGDTSFGRFEVRLQVASPGLYTFQMRNRVGEGTNATEHNDTWVSFPDADAFYGTQGDVGAEDRVYPRPLCEDAAFIAGIEALAEVVQASCPNGTSRDGYFKVYSSGALDWKWSARTSDSDAHDVVVRFDSAGVYTLRLAARGDHHQLDRIVIHERSLDNATVQDLSLPETPCP